MRIRLFLAGIATLFLATGTAPASATWGSLWRCGKVEVHREYYPDMDPKTGADLSRTKELTFYGPVKKHMRFRNSHAKAWLNGKRCKYVDGDA
jgi:hypothetical protein